ncbi:TPA: hypothetical protein ACGCG3_002870, partial [Stenotrophomonas maltophilia]
NGFTARPACPPRPSHLLTIQRRPTAVAVAVAVAVADAVAVAVAVASEACRRQRRSRRCKKT